MVQRFRNYQICKVKKCQVVSAQENIDVIDVPCLQNSTYQKWPYIPNLEFGLVLAIYNKGYTPEMVWFGYQNSTYQDGTFSKRFWVSIPSVLLSVLVLMLLLIFVDI